MHLVAGCKVIALLLTALLAIDDARAAAQVYVENGSAKTGETAFVDVRLKNDGEVAFVAAYVEIPQLHFVYLPDGQVFESGSFATCREAFGGVQIVAAPQETAAGIDSLLCRVPLTPSSEVRRALTIEVRGRCQDQFDAEVPCEFVAGSFYIDGRGTLSDRTVALIPELPPVAPAQADIVAFDYSDASRAAPLAALDLPRPESVTRLSFGPYPVAAAGTPNSAVQELLRAVRVSYQDIEAKEAGLGAATRDSAVRAVIATPISEINRSFVYPHRPAALQPFALWIDIRQCDFFAPTGYDDRDVRLEGRHITVLVPYRTDLGCPPLLGAIRGGSLVLNLPGLAPGEYTLELRGKSLTTGQEVIYPGWEIFRTTIMVEGTFVGAPAQIPATTRWTLLSAVAGVLILAARARR